MSRLNKSFLTPQGAVLADIVEERENQDKKWGTQNHDPFVWMSILMEEVGETCKEVQDVHKKSTSSRFSQAQFDASKEKYRAELVQVAAVAVAALESLDRNEWLWGDDR